MHLAKLSFRGGGVYFVFLIFDPKHSCGYSQSMFGTQNKKISKFITVFTDEEIAVYCLDVFYNVRFGKGG